MSGRTWHGHGIVWWIVWLVVVGWVILGLVGLIGVVLLTYVA
jgi:hypothetical protein